MGFRRRGGPPDWQFLQYVFEKDLWPLAESTGPPCVAADLETTLDELVRRADTTRRHLICWSSHDHTQIEKWSGNSGFRWRNARPTAKKWRKKRAAVESNPALDFKKNKLQNYLRLIDYDVPADVREGAAKWIANVRARLISGKGTVEDMADSGHRDWDRLLEHNLHDVYGMRQVTFEAVGIDDHPSEASTRNRRATHGH